MSVYNINGTEIKKAYSLNGTELKSVYNVDGVRIGFDDEPIPPKTFRDTAVLTGLPAMSVSGNKQGACTDGEYIYQTCGDASSYTYMQIIKYKISNGTYTIKRFDGTPNFGHANDMTYNPNNGYLYICTMINSDGKVIVIDSKDLSYVETIVVRNQSGETYNLWQICFDRLTNRFYSASGDGFDIYNQNWEYVSHISASPHPEATGQGCETDGNYIYRVTYNPNYLNVLNMSGEFVKNIVNPMDGEPETMMYDWKGNYYLNKMANGVIFYRTQIFEETA